MDFNACDTLVLLTEIEVKQQQIQSLKELLADCHRGYEQLSRRYADLEARSIGRGQEIVRLTGELAKLEAKCDV